MVTSSGIIFFSMSSRTKSKPVSDAAGKPTPTSLKPILQSRLNMRVLRSESIGAISAWLPSRRSTAHQIGGLVMTLLGHCRSEIGIGLKGTYFSPAVGIMGFWGDMERLLAPRTAKRPYAKPALETEGAAATGGRMRRTTSDPQGPGQGAADQPISRSVVSRSMGARIGPGRQESTHRTEVRPAGFEAVKYQRSGMVKLKLRLGSAACW